LKRPQIATAASDADLAEHIAAGARALAMPLAASDVERLVAYVRLLERWNATYNLSAIRDPLGIVVHHVLDSLAGAASLVRHRPCAATGRLLDVGSGAGLPGLVIAAACHETEVMCIDKVAKKTAFVTHAAATLGFRNVKALHVAVEAMQGPQFDVIASRALGSLSSLVSASRHLLADQGEWMAMKGKAPADELEALSRIAFHVEPLHVPLLNAARCIVWMSPLNSSECAHAIKI
jgi:16S rRNA (guanine527-N7)-methyltransferase